MHTIPAIEVQQLQQWMNVLNHIPSTGAIHNVHPSSMGLMPASLAPLTADQAGRHELPDFRGGAAFQGVPSFQGSLPSFQGNGEFPALTLQYSESFMLLLTSILII